MALQTSTSTAQRPVRPIGTDAVRRTGHATAALFIVGGLFMAVGGAMHPQGSGSTVEAHLLSMFASPGWPLAHWILLVGGVAGFLALASAWHARAIGPRAQRWLPVAMVGWGFGALELVPHLLAAGEAHELAHHEATPVLDVHVVMQVIASPAVGLTGAVLAVAGRRRRRVTGRLGAGRLRRRRRRGLGRSRPAHRAGRRPSLHGPVPVPGRARRLAAGHGRPAAAALTAAAVAPGPVLGRRRGHLRHEKGPAGWRGPSRCAGSGGQQGLTASTVKPWAVTPASLTRLTEPVAVGMHGPSTPEVPVRSPVYVASVVPAASLT